MTGKLKKKLIFGLLAWGLLATLPNMANAQIINWSAGSSKDIRDTYNAQQIRSQGQKGVDKLMQDAGYQSSNVRAVNQQDIQEKVNSARKVNTLSENISGATNAAAARWKGSRNIFTGAFNVVAGGVADMFRNSSEIEEALQDYKTADNAENIEKATKAANALQQQNDDIEAAKKAVAVYETGEGQKVYMDENMKSIGGMMDGCVPIPLKLEQSKKCILCPLFVILFNTAQTMSSASYDALAGGFKNLLLIGFGLYVAYVTLKQVSSFTKQDGPKYVTDLLTMAFKVLLAYLILTNVKQLYEFVLEPMLSAAMDFGGAFLFRSASSKADNSFMACTSAAQLGDGATVVAGYYSSALFAKIDCFVRSIQQELAVATSIGSSLMCVSHSEAAHWFGIPDMTMLASGLIIWVFSWLVCLAFGFYLIDSVVRLGVIGGLMPFLIAAWPFKLTSGYTKKGWDMFMNAFFTFVFLGLVVSVNIELGLQAITGGEGGYDKIMELVNANEIKPLVEIMSIGMMGLLFLILCCIFGFKLCGEAVSLASQMGGGSGGTIGSNIASLGAGVAKWGTTRGLKAAGKAGMYVGNRVAEDTGLADAARSIREGASRKVSNVGARFGQALGLKGVSPAGGGGITNKGTPVSAENAANEGNPLSPKGAKPKDNVAGENPENTNTAENSGKIANATTPQSASTRAASQTANNGSRNVAEGTGPENTESTSPANDAQSSAVADNQPTDGGATDGGAANAAPRNEANGDMDSGRTDNGNNAGANVNQTVAEAKQKIATTAQEAASSQGATVQQSGKFNQSGKPKGEGKKDGKNEQLKQAKAQIEELRKQINALEIEKDKLEKQLKSQNGGTVASAVGGDAERLKKLTEEKEKAEAQLNNLLNSMKDQK